MVHPSPRVDPENSLYPTSLADNKLPIILEETLEEMMDELASEVEMPPKKSLWKRLKSIFRWKKNTTLKALVTLKKLRMKRSGLTNKDPNSVKRNRSNGTDITARVEKNLSSPNERQRRNRRGK
ncbi:hypothetical protein DPEC_G00112090 [Dallia pectoralis]|uniref:Uncharacterized protein n=1 Tax=Dallia pectoralis TaxID=75939 RepID=A0ACC2GU29_DALPE|nr:hypothetical protein DPEC_G00112090 [Dallia pectoralis]